MMKIIKIKDYYGRYTEVTVTDEFADEWRLLENESQRVYKKEIYHRSGIPLESIDEFVSCDNIRDAMVEMETQEEHKKLHAAIKQLTPTQQRRIFMYMRKMTYREIAKAECVYPSSVAASLQQAFTNLRRMMSE